MLTASKEDGSKIIDMRASLSIILFVLAACPISTLPYHTPENRNATFSPDGTMPTEMFAAPSLSGEAEVTRAYPPQVFSGNGLVLTLHLPPDGAVVDQPQLEVRGLVNIETILTVDEDIYLLEGGRDFSLLIPLEEGPNALEFVASDYEGHTIDFVWTVTYQPNE